EGAAGESDLAVVDQSNAAVCRSGAERQTGGAYCQRRTGGDGQRIGLVCLKVDIQAIEDDVLAVAVVIFIDYQIVAGAGNHISRPIAVECGIWRKLRTPVPILVRGRQ